ncbi:MAG: aspartate aminotransferase family protein [Alistipes sp.]|nr:aspartate aminotransferase family protein [Alistipes sp.]
METKQIMETADAALIHTYNRFPVVLDRGEGVYLYDNDGKKYLDFAAGIAVFALGYGHKEYNDGLKAQIDKLIHTSNLFYHEPMARAAERIVKTAGMSRVFFTNSGTEAVEGAIKLAKKWAFLRDNSTDHEIVAMEHSFHGRSIGALSVTGNKHYQEAFGPLIPGIKFARYNDLESVKNAVTDKTCAVIMETVQGEGGIYPADREFIKDVRKLCDEKDMLLILDEIQCGMGRTGTMFACERYGVKPDIMTAAKALGCGVPVGAFLANDKTKDALVPGDHGTTYGGNPFACAAVNTVLDIFEKEHVLDNVREVSVYLEKTLDEIAAEFDCIWERRGMGLIQGLELEGTMPVGQVVNRCLSKGLIVISAGNNVLRFVPPLVISKDNVDEMAAKLRAALKD